MKSIDFNRKIDKNSTKRKSKFFSKIVIKILSSSGLKVIQF